MAKILDRDRDGGEWSEPATRAEPAPGKVTRSERIVQRWPRAQRTEGEAANVQRREETAAARAPEDTHAWAQHGVSTASWPLPYVDQIQASFGHHDVGGVKAAVGGAAAEASDAMGARAYATGDTVAFAQSPDLHLAAHEAAHVVQQRGGVRLSGGVGVAGDAYEQHADAVAAKVVRGESAEGLLDTMAHRGAGGGSAVQRADAPAAAPAPAPAPAAARRATTVQNIVIHQGPAKDSPRVAAQPDWVGPGTSFDVIGSSGSWLQITYQGQTAYITGGPDYVTIADGPSPNAAGATAPAPQAPAPAAQPIATPTPPTPPEKVTLDQQAKAPQSPGLLDELAAAASKLASSLFGSPAAPASQDPALCDPAGTSAAPDFATATDTSDVPQLDQLMALPRLTPDQIAQARLLIAALPPDQQKDYYLRLQSKSQYLNQTDNKSPQEEIDPKLGPQGGTCNLTSVGMILEYLGVSNPDPSQQFEDVLVQKADGRDITAYTTWEYVAKKFNVDMTVVVPENDAGTAIPKEKWLAMRDTYLATGQGIALSLRGHIVRLQGITDDGLVIDDPFGKSTLSKSARQDRYTWVRNDKGKQEINPPDASSNLGEDDVYPWEDVVTYGFKYVVAFRGRK